MFLERQKLHMREAHLLNVAGKRLGHLTISERTILIFHLAAPRTEMDLVNREWLSEVFAPRAILHSTCIAQFLTRRVDNRGSVWRNFSELRVRISFEKRRSIRRANLKLIETPFGELWNE